MAGVDQSVEEGFGDDGVREQRVPVDRFAVRGQDQRAVVDGPIGDQLGQADEHTAAGGDRDPPPLPAEQPGFRSTFQLSPTPIST